MVKVDKEMEKGSWRGIETEVEIERGAENESLRIKETGTEAGTGSMRRRVRETKRGIRRTETGTKKKRRGEGGKNFSMKHFCSSPVLSLCC